MCFFVCFFFFFFFFFVFFAAGLDKVGKGDGVRKNQSAMSSTYYVFHWIYSNKSS